MIITVIGTGFVGVVTSAVLASLGHRVRGLDVDKTKIDKLKRGRVPFYEPNLGELLKKGRGSGKLTFTDDYRRAIEGAELIIIAVGTPSAPDGTADLGFVLQACEKLAPFLSSEAIVAIKSTVPPGTIAKAAAVINRHTTKSFFMAALPEFLREGSAVTDTLKPDRVVIGANEPRVIKKLKQLHQPLTTNLVTVTPESAQMAKYTANAYLAMRITFINQIANVCEKNGAKISEVIKVIGGDRRIGKHYWYPGLGYGGSCFPKDVKELAAYARSIGEGTGLLPKIDELNEVRPQKKMDQFSQQVGGFKNKKVAVLGLSFKPNTNDLREAPSLKVIPYLIKAGATVSAYDPKVRDEALNFWPEITLAQTVEEAVEKTEVIIMLVEWPELVNLDLNKLKSYAADQCYLIDTRNQFSAKQVIRAGFDYIGVGNG